jgi:hypothetical protein
MSKSILEVLQPIVRQRIASIIKKSGVDMGHARYEVYLVDSHEEQMILRGGPTVTLYISGLNVSGGTLSLESENFWRDVRRIVRRIPDVWEPCLLIDRNLMRVYQNGERKRLKEKLEVDALLPIIPISDMEINTMSTTTFTDKVTGESITIHYNDDDYTETFNNARMALSQRRSAINLKNFEENNGDD